MSNQWNEVREEEVDLYMEVWTYQALEEHCGNGNADIHDYPRVLKAAKNKRYQLSIGNLDLSFRIWNHMNWLRIDMLHEIDELKAQQTVKLDIKLNATDENGNKYHNPNVGRMVPSNMPMK